MSQFNQRQNNSINNSQNINNVLQIHLSNINILANSIQQSHSLIERMQRQSYIENNSSTASITNSLFESIFNSDYRRREPGDTRSGRLNRTTNNDNETNNSERGREQRVNSQNNSNYQFDDDNVLYFTFDTLIPNSYANSTNSQNSDLSFQTLLITEENKETMNSPINIEVAGNVDLSTNAIVYDLFEIQNFNLIENPINDICPITRERFDSTSEHILMIKKCKHIFNKSALNIWLENNNTCPCCRVNIL